MAGSFVGDYGGRQSVMRKQSGYGERQSGGEERRWLNCYTNVEWFQAAMKPYLSVFYYANRVGYYFNLLTVMLLWLGIE